MNETYPIDYLNSSNSSHFEHNVTAEDHWNQSNSDHSEHPKKINCISETHKSLKETDSEIIETLEVVITCEKPEKNENNNVDTHSKDHHHHE